MKIKDFFNKQIPTFSFEFFPPKNYISTLELGMHLKELMKLSPSFVSVTYGAGGSTQNASFELVDFIQNKLGLVTMAHYTCVNAHREQVEKDLNYFYEHHIENLMLLRGDPPKGEQFFPKNENGFNYGTDLVAFARQQDRFCIGAAAYPEKHVEAVSIEKDIEYLHRKVEAGADFLVTQMFFDNQCYFNFLGKIRDAEIHCPVVPGIIPITNFKQIQKFSRMCGACIPEELTEAFASYQDNAEKSYQIGVDFAIGQCGELLEAGVPGIHFYTLNKSRATLDIFAEMQQKV